MADNLPVDDELDDKASREAFRAVAPLVGQDGVKFSKDWRQNLPKSAILSSFHEDRLARWASLLNLYGYHSVQMTSVIGNDKVLTTILMEKR